MAEIRDPSSVERMGAIGQVVTYVKQAIRAGKFHVGDKLPNEADLAKVVGVGRSSLREGMRVLAAYGVVEIRQGEGSFVIDKTAEQFFELLGFMPSANFGSFIELRRVIETGNIVTIYNKLSQTDFVELQILINQLDYKNGIERCVQADREFHKKLLTSTENPLMVQIDKMIYKMRSELLYKIMCYSDVVHDARVAHQGILDALKEQDMVHCIELVAAHLDTTQVHMDNLHIV